MKLQVKNHHRNCNKKHKHTVTLTAYQAVDKELVSCHDKPYQTRWNQTFYKFQHRAFTHLHWSTKNFWERTQSWFVHTHCLLITFTFCRCRWRHLPRKFHGFKENRKKRKICAWTIQIKVYNKDKQQHSIWCGCSYSIARKMGTVKNSVYKNKS